MKITSVNRKLNVPSHPTIPFIEGDGVGAEVIPVMQAVVDAAIMKAYGGKRKIEWLEVLAGGKAHQQGACCHGNTVPQDPERNVLCQGKIFPGSRESFFLLQQKVHAWI